MITLLTGNKIERQKHIQGLYEQHGLDKNQAQHIYENDFKTQDFKHIVPVDTGLFNEVEAFVVHDAVRTLDIKDIFETYKDTEHLIVFTEDSVLKKVRTSAEKFDITIIDFEKEKKDAGSGFNIFGLADALGNRNKKQLWLLFRQAITGASAEEIHGILFWQMKNLTLIKTAQANPGMNNFVYTKNKAFVENFSKMDILKINAGLVRMFHERDSYSTLEIELEKMILGL